MSAIKSNILKRESHAPAGIKVCCIKFIQRIVQAQTPGLIADPRVRSLASQSSQPTIPSDTCMQRPDQNELSLALVPAEHAILSSSHLQAEASGLLDRMLNVFHDPSPRYVTFRGGPHFHHADKHSDALLVTATLNSVAILVRTRATIANRILNAIMSMNPFRSAGPNISLTMKIAPKSMERTIRAFLINCNKQ